jgi:hypothetical protein
MTVVINIDLLMDIGRFPGQDQELGQNLKTIVNGLRLLEVIFIVAFFGLGNLLDENK